MPNFTKITTFIFDVDGVFTDGSVHCFKSEEQVRTFNIKDGYAINRAIKMGYKIVIISGAYEEGVEKRLKFLGIENVFLGVKEKIDVYNEYLKNKNIGSEQVLYMGDDIPDYKVLKVAGLPCCPADAVDDIKEICQYISPYSGGRGAVRDVIEQTMKAQGLWLKEEW